MRDWRITYRMCGAVDVRANTAKEAEEKFSELADEELLDGVKDTDIEDIMCEGEDDE